MVRKHKGRLSTRHAQARALLQSWLIEDVREKDDSMTRLKIDIDQNRESERTRFPVVGYFESEKIGRAGRGEQKRS